ncbi:single-stranded DNA-binding protein, partial [Mycobacterium kansasii]
MTDADTTERDVDTDLETQAAAEDTVQGDAEEGDDLEERLVAEGEIAGDYLEELLDLL